MPVSVFRRYQSLLPGVDFEDIGPEIMDLRAVKSEFEQDWTRKAGRTTRSIYEVPPRVLTEGMTEIELAGLMIAEALKAGCQNYLRMRSFTGEMYTWHVISGKSGGILSAIDASFGGYGLSPAFPMGAGQKRIESGESILIDFGACLGGYQVDLTRMFSLGRPPEIIVRAYEGLIRLEEFLMDLIRPGVSAEELFSRTWAEAVRLGWEDSFLGPVGKKVSFCGHGVGLEINEPPLLAPGFKTLIRPGMTVALELKMVFPEIGAAGLENTVLVTETGLEKLTLASEALVVI